MYFRRVFSRLRRVWWNRYAPVLINPATHTGCTTARDSPILYMYNRDLKCVHALQVYFLPFYVHTLCTLDWFCAGLWVLQKHCCPTLSAVPEHIPCRHRWRTEAPAALLACCFHYTGCGDIIARNTVWDDQKHNRQHNEVFLAYSFSWTEEASGIPHLLGKHVSVSPNVLIMCQPAMCLFWPMSSIVCVCVLHCL